MKRLIAWILTFTLGLPLGVWAQAAGSEGSTKTPPAESVAAVVTRCSKCQHENRPTAKFCTQCGAKLQMGCQQCGAGATVGDKFCSQCGADLTSLKPPAESVTQEPQRKSDMAEMQPTYPFFKMGGFSDLTFGGVGRGATSGFNVGQFVLHVTSGLAPKVNFFGELTLSARADAGTGTPPATGFNVEVERAIVQFLQSDQFKTSVGRYHTPINWWNTAFHHGLWLQTTIDRPQMTRFGGQFIPVHFIGGLVEGTVPAGGLHLNYNVGVGNGRGSVVSRGGDAGDVNNNLAWLVNLYVKPDRFLGNLQVGGSLYRDKITLASGREFRERIVSGHIVWLKETPELIAEYAHVNHKESVGGNTNSNAYYVQAAYRLPWRGNRWKPYYRFEKVSVPMGEPVFTTVPRLQGSIFGVRYDVSDFVALKLEYRNLRRVGLMPINGLFGQVSYAF